MANSNGFIKMAVGALVVAIVAVGVILPLFASAEATTGTVTNDGYYRVGEFETTDTFAAMWDHTAPNQITVNDVVVELPTTAGTFPFTIMGGPDFMARLYYEGAARYFQVWIGDATTIYEAKTTSGGSDMSITLANGVMTFDNGSGTTKTATLTGSFYCAAADGALIMKNSTDSAYVLADSEVVGLGNSALNTTGSAVAERFVIKGTITDGFEAVYYPFEVTLGTITATYADSENDYLIGLLDLTNLTFTATYDNTETTVTYAQMLVPYEVTAELTEHPDGVTLTIIQILPVLVLVGVLMMVVTAFISNRRA